jgi:hypothetical protein
MIYGKIFKRIDGSYVINDGTYHATSTGESAITSEMVEVYLAEHPDALVPEPIPPAPTDSQLEAAAEAQRQARFAEYDTAIMRLKRAERMGDPTATAKIAQWDEYAVALQALNDVPGWFRDTVWPIVPGA